MLLVLAEPTEIPRNPLAAVIQVGGDELASYLRIEERELEAGWPD